MLGEVACERRARGAPPASANSTACSAAAWCTARVVLLGGDPGIGKSTLLLQALAIMARACNAMYVSGEESAQQIALRARRLAARCGRN